MEEKENTYTKAPHGGLLAQHVLVDTNKPYTVSKDNILYKCGWSPFEGVEFSSTITHAFANGNLMFDNGKFNEFDKGERLLFDSQ